METKQKKQKRRGSRKALMNTPRKDGRLTDGRKCSKDTRRLLQRWTFELAHLMAEEEGMTYGDALRQAYKTRTLLEMLGHGRVTFVYRKLDGSVRLAHGTLAKGVDARYDAYVYKQKPYEHDGQTMFTYWDTDEAAFRMFTAAGVKQIVDVTI